MKQVESPEKELRFTRSQQALPYWLAGAVFAMASVTLAVTSFYRGENPEIPHPLWVLVPLGMSVLVLRWAFYLTKHAYVILTPLGLEIFPLWKPEKSMRLVFWHEIAAVEFDDSLSVMTLHHDAEQSSGIHLALRPIPKPHRSLLARAMRHRVGDESDGESEAS